MKYKKHSIYITLLVSISNFTNAQTESQVKPAPSLNERVDIGEIQLPQIKTELDLKEEAEAARLKAEAEAEAARIKELADSEKDAEEKIELVKGSALAFKIADDKSRASEAEAAAAEAKAKALRATADKDAEIAKKATEDNISSLKDAEKAITRAKKAGSTLFDKIKLESEKGGAEGAVTVAEAVVSVQHDGVFKSYTVEKGGSLSQISVQAYGRSGYWRILKLQNGVSPEKLKLGQEVQAPDLEWLMADSGLTKLFPIACRDLLQSRKLFMELEDELENTTKNESSLSAEEIRKKMNQAVDLLRNTRTLLVKRTAGVKGVPNSAAQQLFAAAKKMDEVAKGKHDASTRAFVHEYISNSIVYSVLWARDGFN